MAKDSAPERDKIGVRRGGGRPPGYRWDVAILAPVHAEGMAFLNEDQYDHLARQVRELARQDDPTHSATIDIRPVRDMFEIRDKGGILGKINVRVFYFVSRTNRTIVILGAFHKQNDGPTPPGDLWRMEKRMRRYLETLPRPEPDSARGGT
jgi:phage-related protein